MVVRSAVAVALLLPLAEAASTSHRGTIAAQDGDLDPRQARSQALVDALDKCANFIPPNFNVKDDCQDLDPGGSGSRSLSNVLQNENWHWSADHTHEKAILPRGSNSPRCFLIPLREPAGRIESWYREQKDAGGSAGSIDEWFESEILEVEPNITKGKKRPSGWTQPNARATSYMTFVSNYTDYVSSLGDTTTLTTPGWSQGKCDDDAGLVWGTARLYKDFNFGGRPDVDTSKVVIPWMDEGPSHQSKQNQAMGAANDLHILDCEQHGFMIRFLCLDNLFGNLKAFVDSSGTMPTSSSLHFDENPTINTSKYASPAYMLSASNRALLNDIFYGDDMAIYRHYCLGDENQNPYVPEPRGGCSGCVDDDGKGITVGSRAVLNPDQR